MFLQQKSEDTKGVIVTRSLKSAFKHKGCAGMTFSNVNVTGSNVHTCIPGKKLSSHCVKIKNVECL